MIISLASIVLVLLVYLFVKVKIEEQDLKRQISDYDENSYS